MVLLVDTQLKAAWATGIIEMPNMAATLAKNLAHLRDEAGLSDYMLAKRAGVSRQYVMKLLNEDVQRPSLEYLSKLASALSQAVGRPVTVADLTTPVGSGVLETQEPYNPAAHVLDGEWEDKHGELIRKYAPTVDPALAREVLEALDDLPLEAVEQFLQAMKHRAESERVLRDLTEPSDDPARPASA